MHATWLSAAALGFVLGWLWRWRWIGRTRRLRAAVVLATLLLPGIQVWACFTAPHLAAFGGALVLGAAGCHAWLVALARQWSWPLASIAPVASPRR